MQKHATKDKLQMNEDTNYTFNIDMSVREGHTTTPPPPPSPPKTKKKPTCMIDRTENYHRPLRRSISTPIECDGNNHPRR